MALIHCPDCGTEISDLAATCPKCARPTHPKSAAPTEKPRAASAPEEIIHEGHPVMLRSHPVYFVLLILMVLSPLAGIASTGAFPPALILSAILCGLGLVLFLSWWLRCLSVTFTVTNNRTTLRRGILSKNTDEVRHCDIRNLQVYQSFIQRIFDVGDIRISSAAEHEVEVELFGIKGPQQIADLIRYYQDLQVGTATQTAPEDPPC